MNEFKTLDIIVTGMSCTSCVSSIQNALQNLPGVTSCSVSLLNSSATISYNPEQVSASNIINCINDIGFTASVKDSVQNSAEKPLLFPVSFACGFLTCAFLLLQTILPDVFGSQPLPGLFISDILHFSLALPVFVVLLPLSFKNFSNVLSKRRDPNMNTLLFLSSHVSFILSVWLLFFNISSQHRQFALFFDSSVLVVCFTSIGKFLEQKAQKQFSTMLSGLSYDITPDVTVLNDRTAPLNSNLPEIPVKTINSTDLKIMDIVRVSPGEIIPCDGKIVYGPSSFINESLLTGESSPVLKHVGDTVFQSTVNVSHTLFVQMTTSNDNTYAKQLVKLAQDAQLSKPPIQTFTDFLCKWFVYAVLCVSLCTFLLWNILGLFSIVVVPPGFNSFTFAVFTSLSVLVVSCPCALGLAIPLAVVAACNIAFNKRILIQNGAVKSLQTLSSIDCIVFDKTGTLTYGSPKLSDSFGNEYFYLAKHVSQFSSHPLSKAVFKIPLTGNPPSVVCNDFSEILGQGLLCSVQTCSSKTDDLQDWDVTCSKNISVKLGNPQWVMESCTSELDPTLKSTIENWTLTGKTIVLMSVDNCVVCGFAFVDFVRPESKSLVRFCHQTFGPLRTWILTGDSRTATLHVSRQIGIPDSNVVSAASPTDKANFIKALQSSTPRSSTLSKMYSWIQTVFNYGFRKNYLPIVNENEQTHVLYPKTTVAFVGDGKNDSVALATADVGIYFGKKDSCKNDSSTFIITSSQLSHVQLLIQLSQRMMFTIKLNLFWALSYNIVAIPISTGLFYPWLSLNPQFASFWMTLSSLLVVTTSMLLLHSFKYNLQRISRLNSLFF